MRKQPASKREWLVDQSDQALMRAIMLGNDDAFTVLHDRHYMKVLSFVNKMVLDLDLAQDITQEIFIQVHKHRHNFRLTSSFMGWVYTIARNKAKDVYAYRAVRKETAALVDPSGIKDNLLNFPDCKNHPEHNLDKKELHDAISRSLTVLKPIEQEVLYLHDARGFKHREIAEQLGLPIGTVRSHLSHAKRKIRPVLALALS